MAAARYECELFGLVRYSQELTYEALYAIEERFIARMQASLEALTAEHLDFWGTGDALQFQCGLPRYDQETLRGLADEAAASLEQGATAKLVALDKQLAQVLVLRIGPNDWSEESVDIADAADKEEPHAPRQGDSSPSEY